jgi:hypothetical protein
VSSRNLGPGWQDVLHESFDIPSLSAQCSKMLRYPESKRQQKNEQRRQEPERRKKKEKKRSVMCLEEEPAETARERITTIS